MTKKAFIQDKLINYVIKHTETHGNMLLRLQTKLLKTNAQLLNHLGTSIL